MDDNAPIVVARGVLVSAVLGATIGGSIGVIRSQNPIILSMNMGLNCGVAGLAFFGLREYAISPVRRLAVQAKTPQNKTISDVRTHNLIDSAVAGGLTGAIMSGSFRGIASIPRAAFTSAIVTLCLQSAVNELRVARLHSLAKSQALEDAQDSFIKDEPSLSLPSKIMRALAAVTPVRQLSDDEYLSVLENRQRDIRARLSAIDHDQQQVLETMTQ